MIYQDVITKHIPMANKIAEKMAKQSPEDRDEILSAAYFGLCVAARKQNPKNTYVAACIRSEIRDAIDNWHHASSRDRKLLADYLGRTGNLEQRAAAMGFTPERLFRRISSIPVVMQLHSGHDIPSCQESQLGEMLEVCLTLLPERIQEAFLLKFRDQYTGREIAHLLGLNQWTVSTHLTTALDILRTNRQYLADLLY